MSDLTQAQEQKVAAERAAKRNKLKEAYQRLYNNPFRGNYGVLDPMVFRYEAARAYARDYYKLTPRSIAFPLGLVAFTVFVTKAVNKSRNAEETSIRSGEKTYYERALWRTRWMY